MTAHDAASDGSDASTLTRVVNEVVLPTLGCTPANPDDSLLDLGANSLHLVQMASVAESTFGVEVPIVRLFDDPTVAGIAALVEGRQSGAEAAVDESTSATG